MSVQNAVEEFSRETSEMGNGRVFLPTGMPTLVEGGTSKNFFCKYQRPRPRVSQLRPRPQTVRGRPCLYTRLRPGHISTDLRGALLPKAKAGRPVTLAGAETSLPKSLSSARSPATTCYIMLHYHQPSYTGEPPTARQPVILCELESTTFKPSPLTKACSTSQHSYASEAFPPLW